MVEKREEYGGIVVVRMEKEMEGRMVEELVVEMEGRVVENGRPKEGAWLHFWVLPLLAGYWR